MALRIQRLYRGYVVRKQYYRLILAQKKREELRRISATRIQSIVRLRNAQKLFYELQEAKRERTERRQRRKKKLLKNKVRLLAPPPPSSSSLSSRSCLMSSVPPPPQYLKLGEYKFNMTSAIRNSREILRSMMPLRYIWGQSSPPPSSLRSPYLT
jgi:hypothetical protein